MNLTPVGFVDDDPLKQQLSAQGLVVLGSFRDLPRLCAEYDIEEVLITASRMTGMRKAEICAVCERIGVRCRRFDVAFLDMPSEPVLSVDVPQEPALVD